MKQSWYKPKIEVYSAEELSLKIIALANSGGGGGCFTGCGGNFCGFVVGGCSVNF